MKFYPIHLFSYKIIFTVNKTISKTNIFHFILLICRSITSYGGIIRFPNTFYQKFTYLTKYIHPKLRNKFTFRKTDTSLALKHKRYKYKKNIYWRHNKIKQNVLWLRAKKRKLFFRNYRYPYLNYIISNYRYKPFSFNMTKVSTGTDYGLNNILLWSRYCNQINKINIVRGGNTLTNFSYNNAINLFRLKNSILTKNLSYKLGKASYSNGLVKELNDIGALHTLYQLITENYTLKINNNLKFEVRNKLILLKNHIKAKLNQKVPLIKQKPRIYKAKILKLKPIILAKNKVVKQQYYVLYIKTNSLHLLKILHNLRLRKFINKYICIQLKEYY